MADVSAPHVAASPPEARRARPQRDEVLVVAVSVGRRARRRLQRHAEAARLPTVEGALVLDECVEVHEGDEEEATTQEPSTEEDKEDGSESLQSEEEAHEEQLGQPALLEASLADAGLTGDLQDVEPAEMEPVPDMSVPADLPSPTSPAIAEGYVEEEAAPPTPVFVEDEDEAVFVGDVPPVLLDGEEDSVEVSPEHWQQDAFDCEDADDLSRYEDDEVVMLEPSEVAEVETLGDEVVDEDDWDQPADVASEHAAEAAEEAWGAHWDVDEDMPWDYDDEVHEYWHRQLGHRGSPALVEAWQEDAAATAQGWQSGLAGQDWQSGFHNANAEAGPLNLDPDALGDVPNPFFGGGLWARSRSRSPRRREPLAAEPSSGSTSAAPSPSPRVPLDFHSLDGHPGAALEAHFFVDFVPAHGIQRLQQRSCAACHEFFLPGGLRLGYSPQGPGWLHEPQWIHAPRCFRRANFAVRPSDRIAFSPDIPPSDRTRVVDALEGQRARQAIPLSPGHTQGVASAPRALQPWSHPPAGWGSWSSGTLQPEATPSATPSPVNVFSNWQASQANRVAALLARLAQVRPAIGSSLWVPSAPSSGSEEEGSQDSAYVPRHHLLSAPVREWAARRARERQIEGEEVSALLEKMPCEHLGRDEADPCVVCHEPMQCGQECRRLPCLHLFHRACIDRWLHLKATCPLDNWKLGKMLEEQEKIHSDPTGG